MNVSGEIVSVLSYVIIRLTIVFIPNYSSVQHTFILCGSIERVKIDPVMNKYLSGMGVAPGCGILGQSVPVNESNQLNV